MASKKQILLSLFLLVPISLLAETAADYVHRGAQKYIFGDEEAAKDAVANGLTKFPNDPELRSMVGLFHEKEKKPQKSQKQNQKQDSSKQDQQQQQNQDQQNGNQQQQTQPDNQNGQSNQHQPNNSDQQQAKNERQPNQQQPNHGQSASPGPQSSATP